MFDFTLLGDRLQLDDKLFCIGYPNDTNCESKFPSKMCFEPRGWYLSVGKYNEEHEERDEWLGGQFFKKNFTNIAFNLYPGLMHTCWTYWGHSGAPIFNEKGKLVSLHNSWNDETGMRHGVSQTIIGEFLKKNLPNEE